MLNYGNPTTNPDDMLNGSFTGPIIAPVMSGLAQLPRTAGAGIAASGAGMASSASAQGVLVAWLILGGLLVAGHMVTLSAQR